MKSQNPLQGYRFLVVEDEWLVRLFLTDMIEDLGGAVAATAHSLNHGLEVIVGLQVDCATLDINLAGNLSLPIAIALQEREIPFVFCSAYADISAVKKQLPDVPYVSKPVIKENLLQGLRSALKLG